ncbi:facilitated trehalose transporter Tret1-like [Diorhabda sublineata]|uniref:facilitated trehalose transporter Tret1-like n=1 Tax=Diorhabda sublineata TaxID=1163346 RepID=UPI0024E05E26|nr:facilitated trehalose transporter Tret1-like [Diorhabda sublineata]
MFKCKHTSLLIVAAVNLLATTGDITTSWPSPVFPKLYSNDTRINPLPKPMTRTEESIIGSILSIGACIGPIFLNLIIHPFGYKKTLLSLAVPHFVSFLLLGFTKRIYYFYIARFLAGLSVGAGYSLFSVYVGDIADDEKRGRMVLVTNIFWSAGSLIPLAIGPYTSISNFNLILSYLPILYFILFLIVGAESPYYLMRMKKEEEAEATLMYIKGCDKKDVAAELQKISDFIESSKDAKLSDILTDKVLRKNLLLCCTLIATQELGGYSSILYHLELIFRYAESNIPADKAALIVGFVLFTSSFVAPFLVDVVGRRPLLITSCIGMGTSLALLGFFFHYHNTHAHVHVIRFVPLLSLVSYIISFNVGINTVPWTLVSELFPSKNKQAASSIATSFSWCITAIVTFSYNYLVTRLSIFGTFWLFAGWCFVSCFFCFFFVPETKGKSFTEVQRMLYKDSSVPKQEVF